MILNMEPGVKSKKSLHLCSQYSVIWFVINLMTGFGTQFNCGLNFIELSVYTIIDELILS